MPLFKYANDTLVVMVVDDEKDIRKMVKILFEQENCSVVEVEDGIQALEVYQKTFPDVILMDIEMPQMDGLRACEQIRSKSLDVPILLITSFLDANFIKKGFACGATDYINKPLNATLLKHRVIQLAKVYHAEKRLSDLQRLKNITEYVNKKERIENPVIGQSPPFQKIQRLIQLASTSNASVLITGETGTGKNVIAKAIHQMSEGKQQPFISINCAAIPEHLIEAELFGAEKGAYTGSVATHKGVFELADGGTLFLDEIGEMPIHLQTKLLSVIEDKKVRRLGSEKVKIVNVRLIAATNVNPKEAIEKGKLRNDLFYRLSVICIDLPPLRERLEDLDLLCNWFIKKFAPNRNLTIEDKEIETLKQYSWLGNIRELSNIIERCIILQSGPYLYPSELITNLTKTYQPSPTNNEHILTLQDLEKNHISKIFYRLEKNQTRTAKALNISLNTLKRKLKIYQIT